MGWVDAREVGGWTDRPICVWDCGRASVQTERQGSHCIRQGRHPLSPPLPLSHTAHFTISPQLSSNGEKYSRTSDITNTQTDRQHHTSNTYSISISISSTLRSLNQVHPRLSLSLVLVIPPSLDLSVPPLLSKLQAARPKTERQLEREGQREGGELVALPQSA